MREFTSGQWIETEKGVGQVVSSHDLYTEEYSPEFLRGEKKVGDFSIRICVYKILADFQGKVRKRNMIVTSNIEYCDALSEKYEYIVKSVESEQPKDFERFLNFKGKKNPCNIRNLFFWFNNADLEYLKSEINIINNELLKPFLFTDFKQAVEKSGLEIDFSKANLNTELRPPDFIIHLYNENYKVKDKRALLKKVQGSINSNTASA